MLETTGEKYRSTFFLAPRVSSQETGMAQERARGTSASPHLLSSPPGSTQF